MPAPRLYQIYKLKLSYVIESEFNVHISKDRAKSYIISLQDNQLFRQIRILTEDYNDFNKWIVFIDCNGITNIEEAAGRLIREGFYLNNRHFVL